MPMRCFFCFHLMDLSSWFGVVRNIRFLFRSNPGCGWWCSWGSARCELQLPMPKTPWLERWQRKATGGKSGILRYFWRFSVDSWKWDFHHNWQPKWSKQQKCQSATAWERMVKHWTGRPLRVRLMQCSHPWMRSYCGHLAQLHHMPTSGRPFALLRPLSKSLTLTYCPIQEARSRAQSAHSVASSTCYPRLVS